MARKSIQATAFHEAGHAAAMLHFGYRAQKASIVGTEDYLGVVRHCAKELEFDADSDRSPDTVNKIEELAQICFSGPIAQRKKFPKSQWRIAGDLDFTQAAHLLSYLSWSDAKADKLHMDLIWRRTELLVDLLWPTIEALAESLLVSKTLDDNDLREIYDRPLGKRA